MQFIVNLWRTVTVCMGAVLMGMTAKLWLVRRRLPNNGSAAGQLPGWASAAWLLMILLIEIEVAQRYDDPFSLIPTPVAFIAFGVGLRAVLFAMRIKVSEDDDEGSSPK